jgi:hypothetical protein
MPSRWLTAAILAFWLGTSGWLVYQDLWPRWQPHQPPPYQIDLTAEAINEHRPSIHWKVYQNDVYVFAAQTRIEHPGPDVFELKAKFKKPTALPGQPKPGVAAFSLVAVTLQVTRMDSLYRVNQRGNLLAIEGSITGAVTLAGLPTEFTAGFTGEVIDDTFHSAIRVDSPNPIARAHMEQFLGKDRTFSLKSVPVSSHGSVLMPLHPVNRIRGLVPGQSWRMPVVNPIESALAATTGTGGGQVRFLDARVLDQPQPLDYRGHEVACLVIEYHDSDPEGMTAHTWVAEKTGLVLRQEASLQNQKWVMDRE